MTQKGPSDSYFANPDPIVENAGSALTTERAMIQP
jgi:hypothetical protein